MGRGASYRNEITWKRQTAHSDARYEYGDVADTILFYSKSDEYYLYPQYGEYDPCYVEKLYRFDDNDGRGPYQLKLLNVLVILHKNRKPWKPYLNA